MTTGGYARPELLVDTAWLADHIDDTNLRIIDCDQFPEYKRAHIKNAIGIPVHHYIKQPGYDVGAASRKYPLVMPPDDAKKLFEGMGIGDGNEVICYDDGGCLSAARVWWVLNHYGHTNVKVLNGGWRKWVDEGRPIGFDAPSHPKVTFTPKVDDSLVCTLRHGLELVNDPDTVFLDVRSDGEWDGSNDRGNKRAGRIPGSVHVEWLNFVTSDKHRTIKPADELRKMLTAAGVTPEKQVVTY
jgi:thiosulfate/3-mercaptopyruvate sulfurtransferase